MLSRKSNEQLQDSFLQVCPPMQARAEFRPIPVTNGILPSPVGSARREQSPSLGAMISSPVWSDTSESRSLRTEVGLLREKVHSLEEYSSRLATCVEQLLDDWKQQQSSFEEFKNCVGLRLEELVVGLNTRDWQAQFDEFRVSIEYRLQDTHATREPKEQSLGEAIAKEEPTPKPVHSSVNTTQSSEDSAVREYVHNKLEEQKADVGLGGTFSYTAADYEKSKGSWMAREEMYKFEESAWSLGMLTFSEMLTTVESLEACFVYFVNAFLQGTLVILLWNPFTETQIDEDSLAGFAQWRTTVAHDVRWMDAGTGQSLARLVCSGEATFPHISGDLRYWFKAFNEYTPDSDYGSTDFVLFSQPAFTGKMVCILACWIWWFTCYSEVRAVLECYQAIYLVPPGQTEIILLKPGDIDDVGIRKMSMRRKCVCFLVLVVRFSVVCSLFYIGTFFLIYTISLRDLFLNAIALDLVLNVGELVYTSMAPYGVRHFISSLEPIPKRCTTCLARAGVERNLCCMILFVAVSIAITWPHLNSQQQDLKEARDRVCGGYLDFVFTYDPGGAIVAHPTYVTGTEHPRNIGPSAGIFRFVTAGTATSSPYSLEAIKQLIEQPNAVLRSPSDSLSETVPALHGSALGLLERDKMPAGVRLAELNPLCSDLDRVDMVWPTKFINEMLKYHPILSGKKQCWEGKSYCNWDNSVGIAMRQWCSSTCGCNAANSSLILSRDSMGCPNSCSHQDLYYASIQDPECADHDRDSIAFQDYISGMESLRFSYEQIAEWHNLFGIWIAGLQEQGCGAHKLLNAVGAVFGDLCGDNAFGLKPLLNLCPVTCKCANVRTHMPEGQAELCPAKCRHNSSLG